MREIKFRAWDAENGKMYKPTHEAYKGNLFELFVSFSGDLSAHTMKGTEHESLWPNRFRLMQYTGLKDKNGDKEVYECDIIDSEGNIIGNQYETPTLLEDKTNLLIQGFGTKAWLTTYQEAVARGCHDA